MLKTFLFLPLVFLSCLCCSQKEVEYAALIDQNTIKKNLTILASDSLEGRNTGDKGQKMAADYLVSQFKKNNCKPFGNSYLQEFNLLKKKKEGKITLDGKVLNYPEGFGFNGFYQTAELKGSIRFLNSVSELTESSINPDEVLGICIDSYKAVDIKKLQSLKARAILFFCKNYNPDAFTRYDSEGMIYPEAEHRTPCLFINIAMLSKSFQKQLKKSGHPQKTLEISLNKNPEYVSTENVISYIEGSDPVLKNEVLVISAHYDHLGIQDGLVYNGADDNGSGTSTLLELARVFQKAKDDGVHFKRSLLFICCTGEEHGLFGSTYYTDHPLIPLKQTITDLNIDMIGRKTTSDEKEHYLVYVIGADRLSDDLHRINEQAAKEHTKLVLDYKYNEKGEKQNLYYRSDHYNFAKNGVPSIFYFGGFHEDYHQTSDDVEKIDFNKVEQIAELVFFTAWTLLTAENRPVVNK